MVKTNQNNPTVEEGRLNGMSPLSLELILTGLFIPLAAVVMWYLGKLRNPALAWSWTDYLVNLLYSVFFVLAMRQVMQGALKFSLFRGKQIPGLIASGLLTYFLLQTVVLFLIERINDTGTVLMVYALGLVLAGTYIVLRAYLIRVQSANDQKQSVLKAQQQGRTIYVNLDQVTCLYTESKVTYAFATGKRLLLTQSLTELESLLPPEKFFRISRQAIVSKAAIVHFKRLPNQTLVLHLESYPEALSVSRAKTPAFIAWSKM